MPNTDLLTTAYYTNHATKYRVVLKCSRKETLCEQNLFHARLKSQTGKSSFHLSCERTLKLETLEKGVK